MHVLVFVGGTLRPGRLVELAIASADLVIAADSGAETALHYGQIPSIIIGDFDSLTIPVQELEQIGCRLVAVAAEKDETDSELAIQAALEEGATSITVLGGIGGERFEHSIANVFLLADFTDIPIRIIDGPSICWLLYGPGSTPIAGQPGDLLSLFPLTAAATGVHTTNLYYPLHGETLRFGKPRGISNILTAEHAAVSLESGLLLIIQTLKEPQAHT